MTFFCLKDFLDCHTALERKDLLFRQQQHRESSYKNQIFRCQVWLRKSSGGVVRTVNPCSFVTCLLRAQWLSCFLLVGTVGCARRRSQFGFACLLRLNWLPTCFLLRLLFALKLLWCSLSTLKTVFSFSEALSCKSRVPEFEHTQRRAVT